MTKKRAFSGIQPSGIPTIGNYFGALRYWASRQDDYDGLYSVVDLHALTQRFEPELVRERTEYLYALLLSIGVDPNRSALFVQSHVPAHTELTWILNCYAMYGEMTRMTQFKEKSQKNPDNINLGLLDYPVLMAADILLYGTEQVPVGEDQKQHVEIARDIAGRFNSLCGEVFVMPEPVIPKLGGRVMSLLDPSRKMDKSDPVPGAFISMRDDRGIIIKKFKRAVTDSEGGVYYDPQNKPGVANLMSIYALSTGKTIEETQTDFEGQGYGALKTAVAEAVDGAIGPIRDNVVQYQNDKAELARLMRAGAEQAAALAETTLCRVREAVGLLPRSR